MVADDGIGARATTMQMLSRTGRAQHDRPTRTAARSRYLLADA